MQNLYLIVIFFCVIENILSSAIYDSDPKHSPNIIQLCGPHLSIHCLRGYFSQNVHGTLVKEEQDSVAYDVNLRLQLPNIGVTTITSGLVELTGLIGDIEEFYYDQLTGNLVISVDFTKKGVYFENQNAIITISRPGMEPRVIKDVIAANYTVALTAIISASQGVTVESLRNGQYSGYFPGSIATLYAGPKFTESKDPHIMEASKYLFTEVPLALREIFHSSAAFVFLAWLQNNVCDFGLNPAIENYDLSLFKSIYNVEQSLLDDANQFSYPCAGKGDLKRCVCNYFKEQEAGSLISRSPKDPVERSTSYNMYFPFINSTLTMFSAKVYGVDGNVLTFSKNELTKNLVLAVSFETYYIEADNITFRINSRGRLPYIFNDKVEGRHNVTLTVVISTTKGLTAETVNNAYVRSDFQDPGTFSFGSSILESTEPDVITLLQDVLRNKWTTTREYFTTEGPQLFGEFVRNGLC